MDRAILVAGNKNYGLGKSIYENFPRAKFCSRSNGGYDFFKKEAIEKFANYSLHFSDCIFCSYIPYFFQTILLEKTWNLWNSEGKKGHMIVIGSTSDNSPKRWLYSIEKRALRDWCRVYGKSASGGGPELYPGNGIKITYIAPGMIDLPKQREKHGEKLAKLDPSYIVEVIKWVLSQPENVNIYDISMDPVQL